MIFRDDIEVTFYRKNGYNEISAKMNKFFKIKPKHRFNWFVSDDYYIERSYINQDNFEIYKRKTDRRCFVEFEDYIWYNMIDSKSKSESEFIENLKVFMECIEEKVELLEQKIIDHKIEIKESEFEVNLIPSVFNNYERKE